MATASGDAEEMEQEISTVAAEHEVLPQRKFGDAGAKCKRPRARAASTTVLAEDDASTHAAAPNRPIGDDEYEPSNSTRSALFTAKHSPEEGYEPGFEYLDHTADVLLHSWGPSLPAALAWLALCMYNYMTPLVGVDLSHERTFEASGHDMHSLVHNFLDELLFVFSTEFFVAGELRVLELEKEQNFRIKVVGVGEIFDLSKHSQGTEVKAITYGSMQVHERADNSEIFVVVDI